MATKTSINIGGLIETDPKFRDGRPCLAGTGTTVHAVVARHLQGMRPDEIADEMPHLDLSRIYAALAYYYANRQRIDADLDTDASLYDRLAAKHSASGG